MNTKVKDMEWDGVLTEPSALLIDDLASLDGDIMVLGAAGKLGPSLVELALRARDEAHSSARILAVSRFSDPHTATRLTEAGAEVVHADLSDDDALRGLPDVQNIVFLVGTKFGSSQNEPTTWATNTYLPGRVGERFSSSRIAALSTGNVYPLTGVRSGGSVETDRPEPVGEYAMSCLGRERVLTHVSRTHGTPLSLIRLNYAVELRYGVLVDLARQIMAGEPVDVTTGSVNLVWQGYVNEVILRSLLHASSDPEFVLNLTGPETLSVRRLARKLGRALGRDVQIVGSESETALLSDAALCHRLFGYPSIGPDALIDMVAEHVLSGGPLLDKPTKFAVRDGRF